MEKLRLEVPASQRFLLEWLGFLVHVANREFDRLLPGRRDAFYWPSVYLAQLDRPVKSDESNCT